MENLPQNTPSGADRMHSQTESITPGTWWRYAGDPEKIKQNIPDHGLILLLKEVRIVDGEIHTLIMGPHPTWGTGDLRFLLGDFLTDFVIEPQGEMIRSSEIDEVMGRITKIGKELSTPPSDGAFLAALPGPESKEPSRPTQDMRVPKALLPSGDVLSAQKKVETAIAVMEARKTWVEARTRDMQSEMKLVQRFHVEKVDVSLAGISEQTKFAENMLRNVQTMRLFIGEEQEHQQLCEGQGAASSEPLRLMQKMLYLDEELLVHGMTEGFNGEMFADLPGILNDNPALVQRMLPYDRCVAITRVRRKSREFPIPDSWAGIMEVLAKKEADEMIQILVRDGENVHMIAADKHTSKAERLFPSDREINAIFKESRFGSETREITMHDVEYTDKRAEHDDRALFYKRFLLILWGAHERLGVFGDFIPEGANWLEQTLHDERFQFIHDDEAVLEDGVKSIDAFLKENRASARPGSRVICQWSRALDPDSAPAAFSQADINYRHSLEVDLAEEFGLATLARSGSDLTVKCPVSKYSYDLHRDREFNTTVRLVRSHNRGSGCRERRVGKGFICLDDLRLEDLGYYINSRKAREKYLGFLHLFDEAQRVLKSEEHAINETLDEMKASGIRGSDAELRTALRLWRGGNKWGWPEKESHYNRLAHLCEVMKLSETDVIKAFNATVGKFESLDVVQIEATAAGNLRVIAPRGVELLGVEVPSALVTTFSWRPRSGFRLTGTSTEILDATPAPSAAILWCDAGFDWPSTEITDQISMDPNASDVLDVLRKDDGEQAFRAALQPGQMGHWLNQAHDFVRAQQGRIADVPDLCLDIGLVRFTGGRNQTLLAITLRLDPVIQAARLDGRDLIETFCNSLYKTPRPNIERAMKSAERNPISLEIRGLSSRVCVTETIGDRDISLRASTNSRRLPVKGEDNFEVQGLRAIAAAELKSASWHKDVSEEEVEKRCLETQIIVSPAGADLIEELTGIDLSDHVVDWMPDGPEQDGVEP